MTIERKILEKNDEIARRNRAIFIFHKTFVINLVSSPGSGKTSILERTLERFNGSFKVGVIEGDVQTDFDAQRIAKHTPWVVQIVTNGGCHLEANLVEDALSKLDLSGMKALVIENVGNLVCPANYDLGEAHKVVVLSVTEGEDKPLKYPAMFRRASVLLLNKVDLLPHLRCNVELMKNNALSINPSLEIFETSCVTGKGIDAWCEWIRARLM